MKVCFLLTKGTDILLGTPVTPRKALGLTSHPGKHDLTPESNLSALVAAKRLATTGQFGECTNSNMNLEY